MTRAQNQPVWMVVLLGVGAGVAITVAVWYVPKVIGESYDNLGVVGDWVNGVTAVILQSIVITLLARTYGIERLEHQRAQFESGFYGLLRRYEEAVMNLSNDKVAGRSMFSRIEESIRPRIENVKDESEWSAISTDLDCDVHLGDWLRVVKAIASYCKEDQYGAINAGRYVKYLRGYLSKEEARVLLYYFVSKSVRSETGHFYAEHDLFKYVHLASDNQPLYARLNARYQYVHETSIHPTRKI